MGILVQTKPHPEMSAQPLYVKIRFVEYQRDTGGMFIHLACYASKERSDLKKKALDDIVRLSPLCVAPKEPDKVKATAKDWASYEAAMAPVRVASAEIANAQAIFNSVLPVLVADVPPSNPVPLPDVAGLLDAGGNPDLAKCYEWLLANRIAGEAV